MLTWTRSHLSLVLATDGLWDFMSNEEVVHLVSEYLSRQKYAPPTLPTTTVPPTPPPTPPYPTPLTSTQSTTRLKPTSGAPTPSPLVTKSASLQKSAGTPTEPWVFADSNCSTHLIRNALGPSYEKVSTMLNYPQNVVRQYRDDMTVIVVFFDGVKGRFEGETVGAFREADLREARLGLKS